MGIRSSRLSRNQTLERGQSLLHLAILRVGDTESGLQRLRFIGRHCLLNGVFQKGNCRLGLAFGYQDMTESDGAGRENRNPPPRRAKLLFRLDPRLLAFHYSPQSEMRAY